ncbi:16S rRNA (guanine(527)-N(7))-methyltransferase RsmG [Hungatella effluvii]|uniref:16S rRNA (guanine(527)-N(7))-methyltransferase RsmG n=1 Tax=Hungatella effluvii TaxID=1096246 RepID=UPI0022E73A25|nr:16S rRNA (guanine(527)-N(7))-methyltransferase RsmG [Hungatella effluvii]
MTAEFRDRLNQELNQFSIKLEDSQIIQFYEYYEILVKWNKVMNLTAITEQNEVITKHFVDSLALIKSVEEISLNPYHIIDIGTGAGFPGIPLKIAFPQLKITLMDSLNKRVKFLNEVIEKLDLKEIQAVHSRAEDLGREKEYREKYDLSVSRAVANLSTLSEYCMPFVKPGGFFISYKSGKIEEELASAKHAIFLLSGKLSSVESFTLDGADAERTLVKIEKVNEISKKYPRKAGVPAKEPLK